MDKYIHQQQSIFLIVLTITTVLFTAIAFSDHTQTTTLDISNTPVSNWTKSGTENIYTFSVETNESINKTTINIPATFILNASTINSSGYPLWNCQNTSNIIECTAPTANATTSISIWFNATSPSTDETIYTWYINTTDLNNTENSTDITTGVDGKAPQVIAAGTTLNADLNATDSSYIFLTVNVSDTNINTVTINLSSLGLSNATAMSANNTIYSFNLSGSISYIHGAKTLNLNLTDIFGHQNTTEYISLTINDTTNPAVIFTADQYSVDASGTDEIIFYADITETEINNVTINLTELGGLEDQQMYNDGTHGDTNSSDTRWTFNMTIPETFNNGTYNVYVNATDNSSNYNDTQSKTITIVDVTGPYVTAMTAIPSTLPANGTILVLHVNASDIEGIIEDGGVDIIYIDLSDIGGSSSQKMYDDGSPLHNDSAVDGMFSIGNIIITDTIVSGTYHLNITATDINGNINDTEYIEINITDVTIPNVYSVNLSKTQVNATGSDYTTITANVSDLELKYVYANLSLVGGNATQILSLSGGLYRYTFAVPNSIENGTHTITINATDNSSNYNDTLNISINVIDVNPPIITINTPANGASYSNATNLINISTDETANVTYSIDDGPYILLYNISNKTGTADFPQSNWTEGTHNITINATDAYGHNSTATSTFYLRPDLNITSVYLANISDLYTGDTITINATIEAYGFNVSNATINFYVDNVLLSSQTYNCTCNITEPVTIESTASWNIISKTHYFSANITWTNQTESDTSNNGLMNTTFIQDFETNITTELDFGTIAVAGISTRSVNLTNNAQINQSAITETMILSKLYTFSYNFTRPEKKSFYFAVPANATSGDITVTLSYNTSLGSVTYTNPTVNAPGISRLDIDAKYMNLSSLPVNITVEIDLDETQWIQSDFNTTQTIENKSSEIFTYNLTVPDNIPSGNYTGTIIYENENNSISSNITFSVTAPELWIMSYVKESPVQTSSATYTFYANTESGIKNYSLIIKNNNGETLNDVFLNFSSLNFTKGNENITITLTNGTDGVIIDENNATFTGITADTNKSVILSFNVSNHTIGTYSTKFNLTSSNGEPIENYSVTLQLIIDNTLGISMTHSSVLKLYPANTTTFEVDVKYRDGTPVTGLNESNITALYIKNGASQTILSYLNNFTETTPGTYLLNITLPSGMVGGNFHLGLTASTGTYSGTYEEDITVYGQYLSAVWVTGKTPEDRNAYSFVGYDTYRISITNIGLESSGPLTATLSTCGASYLAIIGDVNETIASLSPGQSDTATWYVDPIANKTNCQVTVTVTGGKFWFTSTSAILSKKIDITDTAPAVVDDEEEDEEGTETPALTLTSVCDVSMCDFDEKCVNDACTYFECEDGYYLNHTCIKYKYSIDFSSIPENLNITQGNTTSVRIKFMNTGNKVIENFTFTFTGLDNTSSYRIATVLDDEIDIGDEQNIVVLFNISSDAQVGRHNITVWFNSENYTTSETFVLSILPDEESIAEIDKWMPELEKDITDFKSRFNQVKDRINGTNYTLLNNTLLQIEILFEETKNATLSGDFMTAYEKKAQIEKLLAEANIVMDAYTLKQGGSFYFLLIAFLVVSLMTGSYILYDQSRPDGYHIYNGTAPFGQKQMRLPAFLRSSITAGKRRFEPVNMNQYHHKPSFEIKFILKMHSLKHRLKLRFEDLQSHQTKLSSKKFVKQMPSFAPRPMQSPHPHRMTSIQSIQPRPHPASLSHPRPIPSIRSTQPHSIRSPHPHPIPSVRGAQSPHPLAKVRPVSKMTKTFEISKTRCGVCGRNFKNKHELELHRKYAHKHKSS